MSKSKENVQQSGMKKFIDRLVPIVYIGVLLITFFHVYGKVFDKKVHLGGDNAGYYILANSIASNQGFTNIHNKEKISHNHFPPGYPVIVAGVMKFFSKDITVIKKVNGLFLLLSIGLIFLVVYKLTGNYHLPFMTCLFSVLNYHLLSYSVIMMSEIPFLFFSTLCFWLFMKVDFSKTLRKNWLFIVLLFCIAATYYIRSTGLAVVAGISIYLLWKKKWDYLASLILGFVLLVLPWYLRSRSLGGNSYMKQLLRKNPYRPELGQLELVDWIARIWNNFARYVTREIPSGVFNFIEAANHKEPITSSEWVTGLIILTIMVFGLFRVKKYFHFILFYVLASFGILLLWPEVWFGVRFMLPLVPLLTFLFIYGVTELIEWTFQKFMKRKVQPALNIILVVCCFLGIKSYAKPLETLELQAKVNYVNKYKNYFDIAKWIKAKTPKESVTCCRKGQLFYLYSNKYVSGYKNTLDREEQVEYLKSKGVDYVVLEQLGYSSTGRYLYPTIQRYPGKFKAILHMKNPDTYLLEFRPELGYWGEWKDDKHHGKGTFTWEDGKKFVGEWKNGKREGEGKIIFPNGNYLKGIWSNDILNGEVSLWSDNDKLIEKSRYKNNKKIKVINENK